MARKISAAGIALVKSYEGCRLTAYKPVSTEQYWTIGWGHYGSDVKQGMTITQAEADALLVKDLAKYEGYVNHLNMELNQNQFDALVSFAYNCGVGNLQSLCLGRTITQIAANITKYNKAGGDVLAGLTRRRQAELELFNKPDVVASASEIVPKVVRMKDNTVITTGELVDGKMHAPIADVLKAAGVAFKWDNVNKKLYLL